MKPIILILIFLIVAFLPVRNLSAECNIISKVEKDQYVHVVFKGTPKGHIKGKVFESDENTCILILSTSADYKKYYVDATNIAAIGVK